MPERLPVIKTYKLFIGGQFPRSESGRSLVIADGAGRVAAHVCHASRKDLRDAVVAARAAFESPTGWPRRTAYNRGQILYRLAEMVEGKRAELAEALTLGVPGESKGLKKKKVSARRGSAGPKSARDEVAAAVDLLVAYAGWCDKFVQVLGNANPVAGPYYNFTVPEPVGVVAVVAPDERPLLAYVALVAPALCAGSTVVALASETNPIPASVLAEAAATSDLPGGVLNLLTGRREELIPHVASHREIDAVHSANLPEAQLAALRAGAAENIKRVTTRRFNDDELFAPASASPWWIERFVEMKTIWHPSGA